MSSVLDYMQAASGPSSAIAAVADLGSAALKIASPFIAELVQTSQQKMEASLKEQYEIFQLPDSLDRRQRLADYVQRVFSIADEPTAPELPGVTEIGVPVPDLFQLLTIANKYALLLAATQGIGATVKQAAAAPTTPPAPVS